METIKEGTGIDLYEMEWLARKWAFNDTDLSKELYNMSTFGVKNVSYMNTLQGKLDQEPKTEVYE